MTRPPAAMSAPPGRPLFTFAVVADTHVNQSEMYSSSPYPCNKLANARTRWVLARLNRLRPDFAIHLGDLVNPVPGLRSYGEAAENFLELARELDCPLHLVPGNHDVGDKPILWGPAAAVREEFLALWERYFGRHFYAFDHKGCHFVVLNAQIINSGLAAEAEQRRWLEGDLQRHRGRRVFVNLHYPPFVSFRDEEENYDNLGEPGRTWLLDVLERHRPEALFAGHVHNYWYNRYGPTDGYILPSTAFVRHDYAEFFRVGPADQNGRNDVAKLGYFIVKVYPNGHVAHNIRSDGETLPPGRALPAEGPRAESRHSRELGWAPLGVDLRHPWAEVAEITATGALDEFERKRVRNDYPLLALWEMGVHKLRIPLQDLRDERVRRRMREIGSMRPLFTVYTLDVPGDPLVDLLLENAALVDAWEIVIPWPRLGALAPALGRLRKKRPFRIFLSRLRTRDDHAEGERYYHSINHGFVPSEAGPLEDVLSRHRGLLDGFVFRVAREEHPWDPISRIAAWARRARCRAQVHVRMASANPARDFRDDLANAGRVAEALHAAAAAPALDVFTDTFMDIDRGYFARNGLVDRRCNPRLGSHVVRHLHALLDGPAWTAAPAREEYGTRCLPLRSRGRTAVLVHNPESAAVRLLSEGIDPGGRRGKARCVDLASGEIQTVAWNARGRRIHLTRPVPFTAPILIQFGG